MTNYCEVKSIKIKVLMNICLVFQWKVSSKILNLNKSVHCYYFFIDYEYKLNVANKAKQTINTFFIL